LITELNIQIPVFWQWGGNKIHYRSSIQW